MGRINKRFLVLLILLLIGFVIFVNYRNFFTAYISYKYPTPVKYFGLTIPIQKGFSYTVAANMMTIYNPIKTTYRISIIRNFSPSPSSYISSLNELLEADEEMIVKIQKHEQNGVNYLEYYSVDKFWHFNVTIYFPNKSLIVKYQGVKAEYKYFKQLIAEIIDDINLYEKKEK